MQLYGGSSIVVVNENRSIVTSSTSTDVTVNAPFRRFIAVTHNSRASLSRQSDGQGIIPTIAFAILRSTASTPKTDGTIRGPAGGGIRSADDDRMPLT